MKIVVVINSFGRGGAEKSTASFMIHLSNKYKGYEIIGVYLHDRKYGAYDSLVNSNIPLYHIAQKGYVRKFFALLKLLKTLKPDVVHTVLFEANILTRFVSLFHKFYLVESLVNRSYASNREFRTKSLKFKNNIIKWIDSTTSFLVDHFHSVSDAVLEHYESVYGKKISCTIIRRGRKAVPVQKSKYELGDELRLFTIARQEYQKGLIYLFEAINKSDKNVTLKIAGREGDASKDLLDYIRLNKLESKIQFIGFKDDLSAYFLEADAYISNSFFEGSPGSVIEAMSYGLPLILSDIPEHREIAKAEVNTIFFQLKNTDEIKGVFDGIFNKEYSLSFLGKNSIRIFSESFVEETIYAAYDLMYQRIKSQLK
ncbi:glycosyltransferase family 4 protein [Flavobacterium sp. J49]|uniref:glycosyltransferase family 4 protein n=1 Tax=Flavobacterium sp. J49 TaxID=2718534 RepID=UPI001594AE7A|nr:glycosyltransferase family 4 protein [Flavobacterium sp. J49]MBF6640017.1 glycosyltransferase family 4 protein [Flavobacterium sp. J49]NIC01262.1 glycosyltransferase family 4 protein [Flavobacterium sp. J49]